MATVSTGRNPPEGRAPEPWRRVLLPIEHGSWSLVLEPVLLALACGGALPAAGVALLGCGVQLARRPARMLAGGAGPSLGRCLVGVACAALLATGGLILLARGAGGCWSWAWVAGGAALSAAPLLAADAAGRARSFPAELLAAALGPLLAPIALLASGAGIGMASAAYLLLAARSVPTFVLVRTAVRRRKGLDAPGNGSVLAWHAAALAACVALAHGGDWVVRPCVLSAVLVVATARVPLWLALAPGLPARRLGVCELGLGIVHALLSALALGAFAIAG